MFVRVVDLPGAPVAPPDRSPDPRERSFEIEPRGERRHRLALRGDLPRDWAPALFRGLADRGIDPVRGHARRGSDGITRARFEIEAAPGAADPLRLDVLELATARPPALPGGALAAGDPHLVSSAACGGSLLLAVTAPPRRGWIAGLLEELAEGFALVPEILEVERTPQRVRAHLHLRTLDDRVPSPARCRALERALASPRPRARGGDAAPRSGGTARAG